MEFGFFADDWVRTGLLAQQMVSEFAFHLLISAKAGNVHLDTTESCLQVTFVRFLGLIRPISQRNKLFNRDSIVPSTGISPLTEGKAVLH